ncbi:MAG: hypothetical protein AAF492_07785, partial [Verrucomicrobiota bacterium]
AGPMIAGLIMIILRLLDGDAEKPQIGDVFKGFDVFLNSFLFCLIWGIIAIVGSLILSFVPLLPTIFSLVVGTFPVFGIYIVAEKNEKFWPASEQSIEVVKTNFFPFLGLVLIASILGSIGGILCLIPVLITIPLQYCILGVAYREVYGGQVSDEGEEIVVESVEETTAPADDDQPGDQA